MMHRCNLAVLAQAPSGLPFCAEPAFLAAVQASGCQENDKSCVCNSPELLSALSSAVNDACSHADQAALASFAGTYCDSSTAAAAAAGDTTPAAGASPTDAPGDDGPPPADAGDDASTSLAIQQTTATDPSTTDASLAAVTDAPPTGTGLPSSITGSDPSATAGSTLSTNTCASPGQSTSGSASVTSGSQTLTVPTILSTASGTSASPTGAKHPGGSSSRRSEVGTLVVAVLGLTWGFAEF